MATTKRSDPVGDSVVEWNPGSQLALNHLGKAVAVGNVVMSPSTHHGHGCKYKNKSIHTFVHALCNMCAYDFVHLKDPYFALY